ncbi:MAG: PHP domain-containing protein [Nitrospira sp.]|jgi:predicted metal-dependent phosphoesterase TrpH
MTTVELLKALGCQSGFLGEKLLAMFHLHTRWSHDSTLHPRSYLDFVKENRVSLLCITDHGTTRGAREVASYLADKGVTAYVPIGMEAYAKEGHLGCIGIKEDIRAKLGTDIIKEVRAQGGVSVYNHPYQHGRSPDMRVAELVDFIEYPNNRTSIEDNFKALQLAIQLKKPVLPGADAHLLKELCHGLVHLTPAGGSHGVFATPLPAVSRTYFDKISEILLKTLKTRKPDYLVSALRHFIRM